jgi:hypothetical protein
MVQTIKQAMGNRAKPGIPGGAGMCGKPASEQVFDGSEEGKSNG